MKFFSLYYPPFPTYRRLYQYKYWYLVLVCDRVKMCIILFEYITNLHKYIDIHLSGIMLYIIVFLVWLSIVILHEIKFLDLYIMCIPGSLSFDYGMVCIHHVQGWGKVGLQLWACKTQ